MKTFLFILITLFSMLTAFGQVPVALRPDISISHVMNVHGGAVRISYNPVDSSLYYCSVDGNVYRVSIDASGQGTDTLLYSSNDHGLMWVEGMQIYDSCLYVCGNLDNDSDLTRGVVMRGKITNGLNRQWDTVAITVPYGNAEYFNHLFSGMTLNLTGDTIFICSGSRGDHGEVQTRNGLFPGLRNHAITSVIIQIPASDKNILLPNDSALLDSGNFVFARGIRNTFDFAYNASGEMFGTENSCDMDMEDELNVLRKGEHYGFPWKMGSIDNPQQFAGFDPYADSLINHLSSAWVHNLFSNDSLFPQIPPGLQFTMPCKNNGPDGAFVRNSITGVTYDAAAAGESIFSFTPHRSPLGISFDRDSVLGNDFAGNCFVLSYTRGDTTLTGVSKLLRPFNDTGEDLMLLKMQTDSAGNNYNFNAYKIAKGFDSPVDAILLDTSMYIIEIGYTGTQSIWRITFPRKSALSGISENNSVRNVVVYPNPASNWLNFSFSKMSNLNYVIIISDCFGRKVIEKNVENPSTGCSVNLSNLENGVYYYEIDDNSERLSGKFIVIH